MSDTSYPLVSAIMLAGKSPPADILAAIRCFEQQTYPYKELIIINNAASQFEASALNLRATKDVFLIDVPQQLTAGMAKNYGIASAHGQILAQFDADCWHAPDRLMIQVANLGNQDITISVLARTLSFSRSSGIARYLANEKNVIVNTMIFIRPKSIDYPDVDKGEEMGILERLNGKIASIDNPSLCCKLHQGKSWSLTKSLVNDEERGLIEAIVKERSL